MLNQMHASLRSKELIFDSLILENYLKKNLYFIHFVSLRRKSVYIFASI